MINPLKVITKIKLGDVVSTCCVPNIPQESDEKEPDEESEEHTKKKHKDKNKKNSNKK